MSRFRKTKTKKLPIYLIGILEQLLPVSGDCSGHSVNLTVLGHSLVDLKEESSEG